MNKNRPWKATHNVTLRSQEQSPDLLFDPEREQLVQNVPVMLIDDAKAYQDDEWDESIPETSMGHPDLMRDSHVMADPRRAGDLNSGWTYNEEPVFAEFERV